MLDGKIREQRAKGSDEIAGEDAFLLYDTHTDSPLTSPNSLLREQE